MRLLYTIAIGTLLFLGACSPAKMALDTPGWDSKESLSVSGKRGLFTKEKMSFGDFHTTSVKRSWTKGTSSKWGIGLGNPNSYDYTNLISVEYIRKKQTVRFALTDKNGSQSEVYCVSKFNAKDLTIGNRPNSILNIGLELAGADKSSSTYYVQLYTKENERPWEMLIDNEQSQARPKSYIGYLSFGRDEYYTIHPVYKMEGKDGKAASILFGTVGFEFRDKTGKPLAAVSLIDKGTIYLQTLPAAQKFLLANACAALLMQDQLG